MSRSRRFDSKTLIFTILSLIVFLKGCHLGNGEGPIEKFLSLFSIIWSTDDPVVSGPVVKEKTPSQSYYLLNYHKREM